MVPIRIAMKVAPSTSALPVASSPTESWSGRIAYFTGPNSAATTPNSAERHEQQRDRVQEEAGGGKAGGEDLGEFQPPRDDRFDVFVGELAAERRQDEEGKDEDRARDRHQRIALLRRRRRKAA